MRFYLIETDAQGTLGCEMTRKAARETAARLGLAESEVSITWIEVDVTADNVRRLLGQIGGYAKKIEGQ